MKPWIKTGFIWGAMMFICMEIIYPLIDGELTALGLVIGIPIWALGGLLFGFFTQGKHIKN